MCALAQIVLLKGSVLVRCRERGKLFHCELCCQHKPVSQAPFMQLFVVGAALQRQPRIEASLAARLSLQCCL
jgi:hypothetical protein